MTTRRKFLHQTSFAVAGTLVANHTFAALLKKTAPSDQLNVGVIGVNGMGWSDTRAMLQHPGINLYAICDIDQNVIAKRLKELGTMNIDASKVKTFSDYRKMLELKEVDIVIIGTPDHWHALQMIEACAAGKHVYVEKPCGNSIGECNLMMAAQKKYGSIVQVGQWQRSQQHFKNAMDFIATGQLGKIRTVKVWCYQGWMKPQPVVPDTAIPAGVDYKRWLGPAPDRTFNPSRFHFDFRWFWDYAGGLMTDWGVHLLDYALLGMKATYPKSIVSLGGEFAYPERYQETPDTLTALYEFDGFNMIWDHTCGIDNGSYNRNHGIAFIGNNATLVLDRGGWEVIEEKISKNKVAKPLEKMMDNGLLLHTKNFVEVIRSGNKLGLHCTIQDASKVATVAQMGNISYRSGQKIEWDVLKNEFTSSDINKEYYTKAYHNGYQLPKI